MKKAFLPILLLASLAAGAQSPLLLSGSSYSQNFSNLGAGLPTGWSVRIKATATSLGIDSSNGFIASAASASANWTNTAGGYKNLASANGFTSFAAGNSATAQSAATDRALGVRQVGQTSTTFPSDTGAAFVLQIGNTNGLTNFNLSFKLQSLDSTSARLTTWRVDYGTGSNPGSFTSVTTTPATTTTGGNTYANTTVTASFGSGLNNLTGPVWIRIVTLVGTTGGGNRTSSAIDDVNLSWTGTAVNNQPQIVSLTPTPGATNVASSSNLVVTFDKTVTAGPGSVYIRDALGGTTVTKAATSADVTISGMTATISNLGLQNGRFYRITFDSTAFKNGVYGSAAIYDTTAWTFTTVTVPTVVTVTTLNETWDAACAASLLPTGWSKQNVAGSGQQWQCYSTSGGNALMEMNGFGNGANNVNEDWLITPKLNLAAYSTPGLRFKMNKRFTGDEMDVVVSTNYDGLSAPSTATWTSLNIPMLPSDTSVSAYRLYTADLTPNKNTPFFIAFKYVSSAASGYRIRIDTVTVTGTQGIAAASSGTLLPVTVLGAASTHEVVVAFTASASAPHTIGLFDLTGREVMRQTVVAQAGTTLKVALQPAAVSPGLYLVRVSDGQAVGVAKAVLQ